MDEMMQDAAMQLLAALRDGRLTAFDINGKVIPAKDWSDMVFNPLTGEAFGITDGNLRYRGVRFRPVVVGTLAR